MLGKYWTLYKMDVSTTLAYRFDFVVDRIRNILLLVLLYFIWFVLTNKSVNFAGFTQQELLTYVFGIHILRGWVFGGQTRRVAQEINNGTFSNWLIRPINPFFLHYFRELGERTVLLVTSLLEVAIFAYIVGAKFLLQADLSILSLWFISFIFAHILYYILSYIIHMFAFWSREAMGPRFLFEWILEFASGAFFPLVIIGGSLVGTIVYALPFRFLVYDPLMIYLYKMPVSDMYITLYNQMLWMIVVGICAYGVYRRGLRRYSGEGI